MAGKARSKLQKVCGTRPPNLDVMPEFWGRCFDPRQVPVTVVGQ